MTAAAKTTERLDRYVVSQLPGTSRAFAAKLINDGQIIVNGQAILKAAYKLRPSDIIQINYQPELQDVPAIDLPIIYEDDDCVVINKPAGILTHSKGAINIEATVATWLESRVQGMSGSRAGIVHRLDRATSGVMICAKHPAALQWLQQQFSSRRVKKSYEAVVGGTLGDPKAIVDMPIERHPKRPQTFRVGSKGKPAVTAYTVIQSNELYSLLKLQPQTGRTHQLRVHLKQLGHPILGDAVYGGEPADRLYLHAYQLELTLPNRTRQMFTAATPPQFAAKVRS